eukprot:4172078-Prymnesium_polylepis.2
MPTNEQYRSGAAAAATRLARALGGCGRSEEGAAATRRALALQPRSSDAYVALAGAVRGVQCVERTRPGRRRA